MLALEVVLACADPVPTFVFDEVDAGVGGKAAIEVGRRLARLGKHAQVIVVTHLPQVAAFAQGHIRVEKGVSDEITSADVRPLDDSERVAELSRMLAGVEESSAAQQHASELLQMGAHERAELVHL
jgi:DNA repair protein RecN (Recombination protein N)